MEKNWIGKVTSGDQGLIYSENDGRNVAVAYNVRDTDVIAAAPELLAVLEEIVFRNLRTEDIELLNGDHEVGLFVTLETINKAKDAIAKANGNL